jgi:hypothetical protein
MSFGGRGPAVRSAVEVDSVVAAAASANGSREG